MDTASLSRPEVVVRVLGPVDVVGAARPFRRAWTLDLVVYLAMHPQGVTPEAWTTALWPDRVLSEPTRHSTVSAARRSLGRSARGHDHLPRSNGRLRLAPSVSTDWARFVSLADPSSPPSDWRAALELVRGRPFEGLRAPDWAMLDGDASMVEDAVVHLVIRVAEHSLAAGDGRGAELAARRGLLASPYDERLFRLLLRAADCQGNPAGVEAAMAQLVHLVGGDGAWGAPAVRRPRGSAAPSLQDMAWVHPETVSLYRALSRRPPGSTGALVGGVLSG